jgi:acyl carrier protein
MPDVREIAAAVLGVPTSDLTEQSAPGDISGWDSLATLEILTEIEEQTGVSLDLEEIVELATIGDWERIVSQKLEVQR